MTEPYSKSWGFIQQVPCTQCGAKTGDRCRSPKGIAIPPHGKRRADAVTAGVWVPGGKVRPA